MHEGSEGQLISLNITHMVVISGCLRGAVSFSCANIYPNSCGNHGLVLSTTTALVLITTFGVGGSVEGLLGVAGIPTRCQDRGGRKNRGISTELDYEGRCLYPILLRRPSTYTEANSFHVTSHAKALSDIEHDGVELDVYSLSHASPQETESEGDLKDDETNDEGYHTPLQGGVSHRDIKHFFQDFD